MKKNKKEKIIKLFVSKIEETVNFANFIDEVINYKPLTAGAMLSFTGYTGYSGYTGFKENQVCYTGYTGPSD